MMLYVSPEFVQVLVDYALYKTTRDEAALLIAAKEVQLALDDYYKGD